jgi:hypothetical protein
MWTEKSAQNVENTSFRAICVKKWSPALEHLGDGP